MVDVTPSRIRKYDNLKKVVVLTSRDTASAAEVLTIVLKEKCDAIIVGEPVHHEITIFDSGCAQNDAVQIDLNYNYKRIQCQQKYVRTPISIATGWSNRRPPGG